tara:strand:+ start:194 stop:727 length:534 start_codon:yes stop_codon:yes gene_type:complete
MNLKIINFKTIKSTNDTAIRMIKTGILSGVIVANKQIKGKGQRGKRWISKEGNLFATFFFEISKNISINKIIKINSLILKETLSRYIKNKIIIKLPNDLLIDKKKVSGILQEIIFKNSKKFLILGIGVNISSSPNVPNYQTTYLEKYTKKKIDKFKLLKNIKKKLILHSNIFKKGNS